MSFEENKTEGNRLFKLGDYTAANKFYDLCIMEEPTNPIGYSNKAMSLIKQEHFDQAIRTCNTGLLYSSDPEHEAIKRKLASISFGISTEISGTGNCK